MPYKHNKSKSGVEVEQRNLTHSTVGLRASTSANSTDMPTIARIRERVRRSSHGGDISVPDCQAAFGLMSPNPILSRIATGTLSAAKVLGEWKIDVESVERYLDKVNSKFNKETK